MKKIKGIAAYCLLVVMISTLMVGFSCEQIYAKGKVKKIVTAKKVNLLIGQKKTVKVKIKTLGKVSKKFTVKASKKGIVKVKKKSKSIVVRGLKEGTTKLTVKSKANKKKKKTIIVNVSGKKNGNSVNTNDVGLNIKQLDGYSFVLKFSKVVNFSENNLVVKGKQTINGKYIRSIPVLDVTTNDKKTYVVVIDNDTVKNGTWLQFTIEGINGKKYVLEIESYAAEDNDQEEIVARLNVEDNIEEDFSLYLDDDFEGSNPVIPDKSITKIRNVPSGVTYRLENEDTKVLFSGKVAQAGLYTIYVDYEDEMGTQYTQKIVWVVGSSDSLQVYVKDIKDGVYESHSDDVESQEASGTFSIYISGGSGDYSVKSRTSDEVFVSAPYSSDSYAKLFEWEYYAEKPGNHKGNIEVIDRQNSSIRKSCTFNLEIVQEVVIKGNITTLSGRPLNEGEITADPIDKSEGTMWSYGYFKSGKYVLYIMPGTYNIHASTTNAHSYYLNKTIKSDLTLDIKMNVYELKLKPSRSDVTFGDWLGLEWKDEAKRYYGEGDTLYLKKGNYNLFAEAECFPAIEYTANAKFSINSDMTVEANIIRYTNRTENIFENNTKKVNFNDKGICLKFVATKNKEYKIYSDESVGKPTLSIYEDEDNYIDGDEGSGDGDNFMLNVHLSAGKTYYLFIKPPEDEDSDGLMGYANIHIE